MSKQRFAQLALQHGLRHPDLVELADAKGITGNHDLETHEGRRAAVSEFKRRSPAAFRDPEPRSTMSSMTHIGGEPESDSQRAARLHHEEVLDRAVQGFTGPKPEPTKPVKEMTEAELDEYQSALLRFHHRAGVAGVDRARVRATFNEMQRGAPRR